LIDHQGISELPCRTSIHAPQWPEGETMGTWFLS